MNYRSLWGAAAEQVKEKINFIFFQIVHKLKLIDFADLSPSPTYIPNIDLQHNHIHCV